MIGSGKNKKSIAYIGNVTAFLDVCISSQIKYGVFNYVDTPDLTMNELVSQVRNDLTGATGVGLRIPYWLGMILGHAADIMSYLTKKKLPISAIRVKKFASSTEFTSAKTDLENFEPPYSVNEGINRTIQSEFIKPDPSREIFYTE